MESFTGELIAPGLACAGHPDPERAAAAIDDTKKRSILAHYRSATDQPDDRAVTRPVAKPRRVLWGKDDPVGPPASGQRFAETAGARIVLLDGGHWAAVEHPKVSAAALEELWTSAS
jgi:pimeloyl-ACP methyl ester carboxylesterase